MGTNVPNRFLINRSTVISKEVDHVEKADNETFGVFSCVYKIEL